MERTVKNGLVDRIFSWSIKKIINKDRDKQKVFIPKNPSSLLEVFGTQSNQWFIL